MAVRHQGTNPVPPELSKELDGLFVNFLERALPKLADPRNVCGDFSSLEVNLAIHSASSYNVFLKLDDLYETFITGSYTGSGFMNGPREYPDYLDDRSLWNDVFYEMESMAEDCLVLQKKYQVCSVSSSYTFVVKMGGSELEIWDRGGRDRSMYTSPLPQVDEYARKHLPVTNRDLAFELFYRGILTECVNSLPRPVHNDRDETEAIEHLGVNVSTSEGAQYKKCVTYLRRNPAVSDFRFKAGSKFFYTWVLGNPNPEAKLKELQSSTRVRAAETVQAVKESRQPKVDEYGEPVEDAPKTSLLGAIRGIWKRGR